MFLFQSYLLSFSLSFLYNKVNFMALWFQNKNVEVKRNFLCSFETEVLLGNISNSSLKGILLILLQSQLLCKDEMNNYEE